MQRLLWDIDGRLVFSKATVKQVRNAHSYIKDMDDEAQLYHQSGSFARFLAAWSSSLPSLAERIAQLAKDVAQAQFWQSKEIAIMNAWLTDLNSVGYSFPSVVSSSGRSIPVQKRAVVCVTGSSECVQAWASTDIALRQRLHGEIDTFLFLSSSLRNGSTSVSARHQQSRSYLNSTVTVLYEDRVIDPGIPDDCHPQFHPRNETSFHVFDYLQQLWALVECYNLVKDYEKHYNIQYQLLVHARIDTITRMPSTFERTGAFNPNTTLIVSPVRYSPTYDDGFTLGPIELMRYFMTRWHALRDCPSDRNYEPNVFLLRYLNRFANVTVDSEMTDAGNSSQYGSKNCHR